MNFDPQNILVIHFGQMGDVILALPALRAIRGKFPAARLTILVGKSSAMIARLAGVFDDEIVVDRVALRDGNKLRSVDKIRRLVGEVRRRKFDFIIDLHSLSETNLLGFLSGAGARLYANRENRSLDFLGKFPAKPPAEDKAKHITDRYLEVLKPLGIDAAPRFAELEPDAADVAFINDSLAERNAKSERLIGLFPGAGHPSRRWSLENFAALARRLNEAENPPQTIVFLGPEERDWRAAVEELFPAGTVIFDKLSVPQLLAAASLLRVLVSNDTGVVHVGAIAGAALVLVMDERAPTTYLPLTERIRVVRSGTIEEIGVDEVFAATRSFLD
ncbi:MAG TPA: glycosyltransferase family 9 protein [Pyrinomonadaceae bacterium]